MDEQEKLKIQAKINAVVTAISEIEDDVQALIDILPEDEDDRDEKEQAQYETLDALLDAVQNLRTGFDELELD